MCLVPIGLQVMVTNKNNNSLLKDSEFSRAIMALYKFHYCIAFYFTEAVINHYPCVCLSVLSLSEVVQCDGASLLCGLNFNKSLSKLLNTTYGKSQLSTIEEITIVHARHISDTQCFLPIVANYENGIALYLNNLPQKS